MTNDIYTREDAEALVRLQALSAERIVGVETGGCPHTAIREDASINLRAIESLVGRFPDLDVVLIESGGDNLAATFSPELADLTIYVVSVCQGDDIPRKGGPAITRSDLLIVNKTDLAVHVDADLDVMERDARASRGSRPTLFTDLRSGAGVRAVVDFVEREGGLGARAAVSGASAAASPPGAVPGRAPALVAEDIHKRFGELEVLNGISVTAREGEVVSIIGSSGSGKSTFLRCLNFLEVPTRGTVEVGGERIVIGDPGIPGS